MQNRLLGLGMFVAGTVAVPAAAVAQVSGEIVGRVTEKDSGNAAGGVTVIAPGPQGDHGTVTGDDGHYELRALPLGTYVIRYYFGDVSVERPTVIVSIDKTVRVDAQMPAVAPERVLIQEKAPAVD